MDKNNFTKPRNIAASGYHLYVMYRPEYASRRTTLPDGSKYFHCFVKNGQFDIDGLIRRIVIRQRHEYTDALLFSKFTGKCLRKWTEGGIEESTEKVMEYNNKRQQQNERRGTV